MTNIKIEAIVEKILIDNYQKYYALAYSYVKNEADALDIVQEGAYKAILKCDTIRNPEFTKTWIYRIMLNEVYSVLRKKNPTLSLDMDMEEMIQPNLDENLDLKYAISKLTREEQEILDLRYFKGMKISEVAEILNENLSTIKSKLYRAIDKLREDLV